MKAIRSGLAIPAFIITALLAAAALADTVAPVAAAATLDLTGIATATIAGVFTILGIVLPILINSRVSNTADAALLATAVKNSLGALQQATEGVIVSAKPIVPLPGVSAALAPAVQYVLDHAGDEAAKFAKSTGFDNVPAYVASKVVAQLGLGRLASARSVVTANPAPAT